MSRRISYFITPHGFGHATRSIAVMSELQTINPDIRFQIITTVPRDFFSHADIRQFDYVSFVTDIGLVQTTPTTEDVNATITRLEKFFLGEDDHMLSRQVQEFNPHLIVNDISALGVKIAHQLNIPSVLLENFTWDTIYEGYAAQDQRMRAFGQRFSELYKLATLHIQTMPVCAPRKNATQIAPISRRLLPSWQRPSLIKSNEKYVLISMGGSAGTYPFLDLLKNQSDLVFVIAGEKTERRDNVIRFASNDPAFYHPNLVEQASLVVSKAGYSTVAEVYWAGVPFIVVERPLFRESAIVIDFISQHSSVMKISQRDFDSGSWLSLLPALINLPKVTRRGQENGRVEAAHAIHALLSLST